MKSVSFVLCLCMGSLVLGQESQVPKIKNTLLDQVRALAAIEGLQEKRFKKIEGVLSEINKRPDLSDEDRAKIEALMADQSQVKRDFLDLLIKVEVIKNEVDKKGDDIDELKKNLDLLAVQQEKAAALKQTVDRLEKAPEEFKSFTRITARSTREDLISELEATQENKRIPLAGKEVRVALQFKDGPLDHFDAVVSDKNGVVQVKRPSTKNMLSPTYVVFRFAGDSANRAAETRIKIR